MTTNDFGLHAGYAGMFTRAQAPGAIPNGTRIVKTNSESGDSNPDGSMGTVLGSMHADELGLAYFIEWDRYPRVAVGTIALKIKRPEDQEVGQA